MLLAAPTIQSKFNPTLAMKVHPLIFEPIFKPRIWGGRKLQSLLSKRLPEGAAIGESWEIADLEDDSSVVAQGPAKGTTIRNIVQEWRTDLVGRAPLSADRFPLLIKFLDATETLSIQVHPDEATARRLGGRVSAKHEAWYVIDAEEDEFIYRGLRPGVDLASLRQAIEQGRVETALNRLSARKGHAYFLPAGTIHALGAGVVVAEVQTPSDVTYRLHDWKRIDPSTGSPRPLHLDQAMSCISTEPVPAQAEDPRHVGSVWTSITSLIRCDSFVIERVRMVDRVVQQIPYQEMMIWIMLEGHGSLECADLSEPILFGQGDTVLLPAGLRDGRVQTLDNCMWLEVSVPIKSSLTGFDRPTRASLNEPDAASSRFVPLSVPDRPEPS